MKLLGRLAQSSVVLLYEVPANLILGEVIAVGRCVCGIDGGGGVEGFGSLVLLLVGEVAVGCHVCVWGLRGSVDLGRRVRFGGRWELWRESRAKCDVAQRKKRQRRKFRDRLKLNELGLGCTGSC